MTKPNFVPAAEGHGGREASRPACALRVRDLSGIQGYASAWGCACSLYLHCFLCPFVNLAAKASLPELSPKQLKKLKQLTIVSLAQKEKIVSYTALQESLDITNLRELEDLVIESIYAVRDNDRASRCALRSIPFHAVGAFARQA